MLGIARIATTMIIILGFSLTPLRCSSPNFSDLQTAKDANETTLLPIDATDTFSSTHGAIYVTGRLNDAIEPVDVTIKWYFMGEQALDGEKVMIYEYTLSTTSGRFKFWHTENGLNGWKIGHYEARLFLEDKHKETLSFNIVE